MTSMERPLKFKQAGTAASLGRETKRRRISSRRRRRRAIHIPNDIVEEVLVRLPVISVTRFQTVSKDWRSLIRSRGFGERYASYHNNKNPKLLCVCDDLVNRAKNTLHSTTMTLETMTASRDHRYVRSEKLKKFTGFLETSESCDGLVCIYGMTIPIKLMNAASGKSTRLPLANIQRLHIDHPNPQLKLVEDLCQEPDQFRAFTRLGFGKDTVTGICKLVWLYNKYPPASTSSTSCEVLDLFEDKIKWRFVSTAALDHHHVSDSPRPVFANGSFYWLTGDGKGYPTTQTKLIVFDIHTEMFQVTETPPFVKRDACGDKIGVCNLDGCLCVSELKADCKQEFWWRVKDQLWEKIFSVDLNSTSTWFGGVVGNPLTPLIILKDKNKVILSLSYQDNLVSFDLDPHSTVYHLYLSGYYGLAVPYFPSLFTIL
ncbi:hypothetical protein Bca52824_059001 [Brassica carinata]|uniref:F-box domain-containing protein n=1 Tax=Brassica carinata TaxID=52824 RepID=A0A8X7QUM6_BRACI|nr:hypothetical protein Bca52824_059001 [Brassica carinata]